MEMEQRMKVMVFGTRNLRRACALVLLAEQGSWYAQLLSNWYCNAIKIHSNLEKLGC